MANKQNVNNNNQNQQQNNLPNWLSNVANNNNANNANNNQNQQQNNQQGSLLRRVGNIKNNNANNANNANNNQNQQQNNQNQQQNNNNTPRSRFGNGNRFGNNNKQQPLKPTWTITPMQDAGVKIAFQGTGDPLFRILRTPLDKSLSDIEGLVEKLTNDNDLHQQLIDKLDEAWESYVFCGATMMHTARKNILESFTSQVMPIVEPELPDDTDNVDNNNNFTPPPPLQPWATVSPYKLYRAVDATFVLNILGRVRGNVLVEDTPLALESGFLNQSYICNDSRIVELALATGAIEEI